MTNPITVLYHKTEAQMGMPVPTEQVPEMLRKPGWTKNRADIRDGKGKSQSTDAIVDMAVQKERARQQRELEEKAVEPVAVEPITEAAIEPAQEPEHIDLDNLTHDELVNMAIQMGIKVDKRWGDDKLRDKIADHSI
jgi:hypothetical protein